MKCVIIWSVFAVIGSSSRFIKTASSLGHGLKQTKMDGRVLQGDVIGQCPSSEEREIVLDEIHTLTKSAIASSYLYTCKGIPGWRRVAFINMTDTSYSCPTGLRLTSHSKRTCGRSNTNAGCSSTTFNVGGLPYSSVCGRIRGYQFGATSAFYQARQGIERFYVDGVSLTHGGAGVRQHIWTFAAGIAEGPGSYSNERCPCDTSNYNLVPSFVGNSYFCESGTQSPWAGRPIFYPSDILWDGQNCAARSTCCQLNSPPWFTKNLPSSTTDDIELRICSQAGQSHDDVPLEIIELYVK